VAANFFRSGPTPRDSSPSLSARSATPNEYEECADDSNHDEGGKIFPSRRLGNVICRSLRELAPARLTVRSRVVHDGPALGTLFRHSGNYPPLGSEDAREDGVNADLSAKWSAVFVW
jgi:hypothetical protein